MEGFETLDRFWSWWVEASDPPLTPAIFAPSVAAHVKKFKKWLETPRPDRAFTVAADSREEAVAFVACLLRHEDIPDRDHDRAVVFKSASPLRTLAPSSSPFIPIVYNEETEREIATLYRQRHCIVVRPRNAVEREPDAVVELLGHATFVEALAGHGLDREGARRSAGERVRPIDDRAATAAVAGPDDQDAAVGRKRGGRAASDPDGTRRRVVRRSKDGPRGSPTCSNATTVRSGASASIEGSFPGSTPCSP